MSTVWPLGVLHNVVQKSSFYDRITTNRCHNKVTPISERRTREERPVEKIQPVGEPKSWRDYAVWIGIGVAVVVSFMISLYLYLTHP